MLKAPSFAPVFCGLLSFPVAEYDGSLLKKFLWYCNGGIVDSFVPGCYRDRIAAAPYNLDLVYFETVAAILANEVVSFLYIITLSGVITDLAGVKCGSDASVGRSCSQYLKLYSFDFNRKKGYLICNIVCMYDKVTVFNGFSFIAAVG